MAKDNDFDIEKLKALKELGGKEGMPEAEQVRDILKVVGEEIPTLLNSIKDVLYSPESAKQFAQSIGTFYSELKKQGVPDEIALDMTEKYASTLNIAKAFSGINLGEHHHD